MYETYEIDPHECDYCEVTYYEYDTGYKEYGCSFITGNKEDNECMWGELENGCPLAFRYRILK